MRVKGNVIMATGLHSINLYLLSQLNMCVIKSTILRYPLHTVANAYMCVDQKLNVQKVHSMKFLHKTKAPKVCGKSWAPKQTFYDRIKFDLFHLVVSLKIV